MCYWEVAGGAYCDKPLRSARLCDKTYTLGYRLGTDDDPLGVQGVHILDIQVLLFAAAAAYSCARRQYPQLHLILLCECCGGVSLLLLNFGKW